MKYLQHATKAAAQAANAAIYDRIAPPVSERCTLYLYSNIEDPDTGETALVVDDETPLEVGEVAALKEESGLSADLQDLLTVRMFKTRSQAMSGPGIFGFVQGLKPLKKEQLRQSMLEDEALKAEVLGKMVQPQKAKMETWLADGTGP